MKNRQQITKELYNLSLSEERKLMREIAQIYDDAAKRASDKIEALLVREGDRLSGRIYHAHYQKVLKDYLENALDEIKDASYEKITSYLANSYDDGFLGAIYSMQAQGVPLIFPPDAREITYALMTDSKLSRPLYETLGINLTDLKEQVKQHVAMGIASGESWEQVAWRLNMRMQIGYRRSIRIARTEGHRVQAKAAFDAINRAKENGADVLKEWISAADIRSRNSHKQLHRQLREVGEPFEVNGREALYPGGFGVASEDINCRCVLGERARWASDAYNHIKDEDIIVKSVDENTYVGFKRHFKEAIDKNAEGLYKAYKKMIEDGSLMEVTSFEKYLTVLTEIEDNLVGIITKEGIEIKTTSLHFVTRTIGNGSDHIEVPVDLIKDALLNPVKVKFREGAVKYYGECAVVTVNSSTGNLIQCNIKRTRR